MRLGGFVLLVAAVLEQGLGRARVCARGCRFCGSDRDSVFGAFWNLLGETGFCFLKMELEEVLFEGEGGMDCETILDDDFVWRSVCVWYRERFFVVPILKDGGCLQRRHDGGPCNTVESWMEKSSDS